LSGTYSRKRVLIDRDGGPYASGYGYAYSDLVKPNDGDGLATIDENGCFAVTGRGEKTGNKVFVGMFNWVDTA
jgi:hypothetical protein